MNVRVAHALIKGIVSESKQSSRAYTITRVLACNFVSPAYTPTSD